MCWKFYACVCVRLFVSTNLTNFRFFTLPQMKDPEIFLGYLIFVSIYLVFYIYLSLHLSNSLYLSFFSVSSFLSIYQIFYKKTKITFFCLNPDEENGISEIFVFYKWRSNNKTREIIKMFFFRQVFTLTVWKGLEIGREGGGLFCPYLSISSAWRFFYMHSYSSKLAIQKFFSHLIWEKRKAMTLVFKKGQQHQPRI